MNNKWSLFFSLLLPLQFLGLVFYLFLKDWFPEVQGAEVLGLSAMTGLLALWSLGKHYNAEKIPRALLLRYFILLEALIFFYHKFFREGGFPPDFSYSDTSLLLCLAFPLFSWLMTLSIYSKFLFREHFYHLLLQKGRVHIKEQLRNLGYYMGQSLSRLQKLEWIVRGVLLLEVLSMSIVYGHFRTFQSQSALFLTGNALLLVYWLFRLKQNRENDLLLGDGVLLSPASRKGEGWLYLLLTFLCILAALAISGRRSLLSLSLIGRFFLWLKSKIRFKPIPIKQYDEAPELPEADQTPEGIQQMFFEDMPQKDPWHLPPEWKQALLILVLLLAAAAFLYYMVYPLFKRRKKLRGKNFTLKRLLQEWLDFLRTFIGQLGKKKDSQILRVEWDDKAQELKPQKNRSKAAAAHKASELRGMRRNFKRICRWGRKQNLPFLRGLSPEEYCRYLGKALPSTRDAFFKAAELFQEYYYAPEQPSPERIEDLEQWIKKLEKRRQQA